MVGCGKALFHVAEANAAAVMALVLEVVLAVIFVDERSAGLKRLLHVEDGRQLLVFDLHPGGRLARRRQRLGDHRDDRLALVADLVDGERRLVVGLDLDQAEDRIDVLRHVLVGEDAHDARSLLRLARIDRQDARVVVGAAHHVEMQEAREGAVREESCLSSHMTRHVGPLQPNSQLVEVVVALVGEIFFCKSDHRPPRPRRIGAGCRQDRIDDWFVAGTAANVPRQSLHHLVPARIRRVIEQGFRGHDHPWGAVAALGGKTFEKGALKWVITPFLARPAVVSTVSAPAGLSKRQTRKAQFAIDKHGARAARALMAAALWARYRRTSRAMR